MGNKKLINKNKGLHTNLFSNGRINPVVTVSDVFLEFHLVLGSTNLVFENQYFSKKALINKFVFQE